MRKTFEEVIKRPKRTLCVWPFVHTLCVSLFTLCMCPLFTLCMCPPPSLSRNLQGPPRVLGRLAPCWHGELGGGLLGYRRRCWRWDCS